MKQASSDSATLESAQLVTDSTQYYEQLRKAIGLATHSIEFEYYIFSDDSLGARFIAALGAAAERKVQVRVLIDGIGSMGSGVAVASQLHARGVDVRIYHPAPWLAHAYRWSRVRGGLPYKFLLGLLNINRRNHRKLCVVDGEQAWVGSFNIALDHLPREAGGSGWRDYAVCVRGPVVDSLVLGFNSIWEGHKPRFHRGFIRRYLTNRSTRARLLKNRFVVRSLEAAKHRVWLVSAYFAPTARLRRALLRACQGQAQVRLLLPGHSDVRVFPSLSAHYYRELLRSGARIFLYQPSVLHAKALLIDEFFILGSSNWNHRSTLHDLELDVIIHEAGTIAQLEQVVAGDCVHAQELTLAQLPSPSIVSWVWYALRYWM